MITVEDAWKQCEPFGLFMLRCAAEKPVTEKGPLHVTRATFEHGNLTRAVELGLFDLVGHGQRTVDLIITEFGRSVVDHDKRLKLFLCGDSDSIWNSTRTNATN